MSDRGNICSRKVVAQVLDLTERRVLQLTQDGVLEEYSAGWYKLLPAIRCYIQYLRSKTEHGSEKDQLAKVKRESAELDLAVKKNELHLAADIEFVMTNMLVAFKAKLETLPYKVLPTIIGVPDGDDRVDRITTILKSAVEEALAELSQYDPGMFDEEAYLAGLDDSALDA